MSMGAGFRVGDFAPLGSGGNQQLSWKSRSYSTRKDYPQTRSAFDAGTTLLIPLRMYDTVASEPPVAAAMSLMVTVIPVTPPWLPEFDN